MQDVIDPYPHDPHSSTSSHDNYRPLPKTTMKHLAANAHLYPIDETEDFHDPFSDLSLFLSKKIKSEVEKNGSSRQWSHKIEQDLLAGILPEFKIKFPKYRIGISAIKKVWEKVSYYYGKVQGHQEAIQHNGKLNVGFMIKENLRGYPFASMAQLPHYNTAHQIAVKISECVATLEGVRPRLDRLTKIVWAAQKHLIKDLPSQQSKHVHEEYDHIDKLIIKLLLETTSNQPLLSQKELEEVVHKKLVYIKEFTKKFSPEKLYHHLASILSQHLYPTLSLHKLLSSQEKERLLSFIETQLSIAPITKDLPYETRIIETIQRILALYPLATSLPSHLPEATLRACIAHIYAKEMQKKQPPCPEVPASLLTFIQAEMHFLKRKEEMKDAKAVESMILKTLMAAKSLPVWRETYTDELEILIWHFYNKHRKTPLAENHFLSYEIENFLIDFPNLSFKNTLYQMLNFFKKLEQNLSKSSIEEETRLWEEIEHKIYVWTIQNDMLCRWIHFDAQVPLLKIIRSLWTEGKYGEKGVNHSQFVQEVFKEFTHKTAALPLSESLLRTRITLLYKYFWYHDLSHCEESSLDRFIKWHMQEIREEHHNHRLEERVSLLEHRISQLLPLTPVPRRSFEKSA